MANLTPVSGASAYATPDDMIGFYDVRSLGDLCSRTGVKLTSTQLQTDPTLLNALQAASGLLESALFRSGKYAPTDLAALTGNSLVFAQRLVCDIAFGLIVFGRPHLDIPVPPTYTIAMQQLKDLGMGTWIFGFQEVADKGVVTSRVQTEQDVETLDLSTKMANRYFGSRSNTLNG